jgi:hypothetical protein
VIIAILAGILGYMAYLNYQEEIKQTKEFQNIKPFQKHLAHPTLARAALAHRTIV